MSKKIIIWAVLLGVILTKYQDAVAQSYYEYEVRHTKTIPIFDGIYEPAIWDNANATPLLFCVDKGHDGASWDWSDWPGASDSSAIWVAWRAAWDMNGIYFFVTMEDDTLDDDQQGDASSYNHDDSIQLFFESNRTKTSHSWDWNYDLNYLNHSAFLTSFFIEKMNGGGFRAPNITDNSYFISGVKSPTNKIDIEWYTESALSKLAIRKDSDPSESQFTERSLMGNGSIYAGKAAKPTQHQFSANDYIWFNIIYNDADNTKNQDNTKNERTRRIGWNEHYNKLPAWDHLGKLKLIAEDEEKQKALVANNGIENIIQKLKIIRIEHESVKLDGLLNESGYKNCYPVILTSSRDIGSFEKGDSTWIRWSKFSDAAVIWRAFLGPNLDRLYLGFEIFDNHTNINSSTVSTELLLNDGLQIMIDIVRDGFYKLEDDKNIFIVSHQDSIYKKSSGTNENYFKQEPIKGVRAKSFLYDYNVKWHRTHWTTEVAIDLPPNYFTTYTDSIISFEIGYNDVDSLQDLTIKRENQLVWSTATKNKAPWANFNFLGKFKITAQRSSPTQIDNSDPFPPGTPIDDGQYTNSTIINFHWTSAKDFESGIDDYHLHVGTATGDSNVINKWIGFDSTYTFNYSDSPAPHDLAHSSIPQSRKFIKKTTNELSGQTLYAMVCAKNGVGKIGEWSGISDGITIDTTPPNKPGKPEIVYASPDSVTFNWTAANDPESGIIDYHLHIRTASGDTFIWIKTNDTKFIMERPDDQIIYVMVQAKNGAGSVGEWSDYGTLLKADIVFALDLSQNMAGQIEAMKQTVVTTMNDIRTAGINAFWGVASFVDYPATYNLCNYSAQYGTANDFAWKIEQELTSDTSLVAVALKRIEIQDGADAPQSYSRALLECLFLNWRADARKFIIMIGNAPAHDCDFFSTSYGIDPGPDGKPDTWDDLDYETVVEWVNRAGLTIISLDYGEGADATPDYDGDVWKNFEHMATATGGRHFMKDSLKNVNWSSVIEEIVSQGPKSDSLFYPWLAEAELMFNRKPYYGAPCENGWKLNQEEKPIYSGVVFLKDTLYQFNVVAQPECAGNKKPWMMTKVEDVFQGTCEISRTGWNNYGFTVHVPKGYHCLSLSFLNDWWDQYEGDLNLLIDKVTINYHSGQIDTAQHIFEAEEMSTHSDGTYGDNGFWVLNMLYAHIAHNFYFEKEQLDCKIFAKADSFDGDWPGMHVLLDDDVITSFVVDNSDNIGYQFSLSNIEPGHHRIKIAYDNNRYHPARKLYVDKLIIYVKYGGLLKSENERPITNELHSTLPENYDLAQNSPNPFNPDTYIKYQLPEDAHVLIKVFNTIGQEIITLVDMNRKAGFYSVYWNGLDQHGNPVGTGIYLYQIRTKKFLCTRKMIMLK